MNRIDTAELIGLLKYDETSPSGLRWVVAPSKSTKAGDVAGYLKQDGYYAVKVKGKLFPAHRLVMQLHGQDMQGQYVDHIDRNRGNNRIENLRIATITENNNNKTIKVRHETVRGFRYYSVLDKSAKQIKRFSVYALGEDTAMKQAHLFAAQKNAALESRLAALEAK
jgi:hypothetical protein